MSRKSRKTIVRCHFNINTGKRRKIQANTVQNCQLYSTPQGFDKTYILLSQVYKKLYTGIIDRFLGWFTNFVRPWPLVKCLATNLMALGSNPTRDIFQWLRGRIVSPSVVGILLACTD